MTGQDLIKVARENIDAFNSGDWRRFEATLTADSVYDEVGTQQRMQGADARAKAWQAWKQAFPDVKGTVTNAFASDHAVTLEVTWEGTHTGPLTTPGGTIPASGRRQVTRAAMVSAFQGDKIKESRHYFDLMALLQQIGAAPQ